jgi:hypothetical protein
MEFISEDIEDRVIVVKVCYSKSARLEINSQTEKDNVCLNTELWKRLGRQRMLD